MGVCGKRASVVALALLVMPLMPACGSGMVVLGRLDDTAADGGGAEDGAPDADPCTPPAPLRRYTFDGTGTSVVDVQGGAPARLFAGAALTGNGVLHLDGVDDYADLPNGILHGLDEVTVFLWVQHLGGPGFSRVFDFGMGDHGEDPAIGVSTVGTTYLALTPSTLFTPKGLAILMTESGSSKEVHLASSASLLGAMHSVAVVVAPGTMALYVDGVLAARGVTTVPLPAINDSNAWLGRSQYDGDPHIAADYDDLRIYGAALTDCAIAAVHAGGAAAP